MVKRAGLPLLDEPGGLSFDGGSVDVPGADVSMGCRLLLLPNVSSSQACCSAVKGADGPSSDVMSRVGVEY